MRLRLYGNNLKKILSWMKSNNKIDKEEKKNYTYPKKRNNNSRS